MSVSDEEKRYFPVSAYGILYPIRNSVLVKKIAVSDEEKRFLPILPRMQHTDPRMQHTGVITNGEKRPPAVWLYFDISYKNASRKKAKPGRHGDF